LSPRRAICSTRRRRVEQRRSPGGFPGTRSRSHRMDHDRRSAAEVSPRRAFRSPPPFLARDANNRAARARNRPSDDRSARTRPADPIPRQPPARTGRARLPGRRRPRPGGHAQRPRLEIGSGGRGTAAAGVPDLPLRRLSGSPLDLGVNLGLDDGSSMAGPGRLDRCSAEPKPGSSGTKLAAARNPARPVALAAAA
jgi:hypothetical protein